MKDRFNYNANTIEEAKEYIYCRSKQLIRKDYILHSIEEFEWGISAYFEKNNKLYQSIYILCDWRGKGIFKKNVKYTILTTYECDIEQYLIHNNIDYVIEKASPFKEYEIISDFYKGDKAKRSGVYLMNHIDEGLYILEKIGASETAKKAYCLHPIFQSDQSLFDNYHSDFSNIDQQVIICAIEYRSVANEYLSQRKINSLDEIRLSPLKDVNDMLIADKIQNKKDFMNYHYETHKRSSELLEYFNNWLKKLNISDKEYNDLVKVL